VVWVLFGLSFVRSLPDFFFRYVNEWLAVLAAAFCLALVAVVKSSPRWIVHMFFALISFFLLWFIEMFLGASAGVSGLA
jgi:hypothetical protein